jgi:hypothetical protein
VILSNLMHFIESSYKGLNKSDPHLQYESLKPDEASKSSLNSNLVRHSFGVIDYLFRFLSLKDHLGLLKASE